MIMIEIFFKLKSEYNFYFICNICNNFELHSKKLPILTTEEGEVFFRFVKQELNARHLISINTNGIEVMLYMTLITAMLVLIYSEIEDFFYCMNT